MTEESLQHPTIAEASSKGAFIMSSLFSIFHLAMMGDAFWNGGPAPPREMIAMHSALVGLLYVVPKELARWTNGPKFLSSRPGHALVWMWIAAFTGMCGIQHFGREAHTLPDGMLKMTLILAGTLTATAVSKAIQARKAHAAKPPFEKTSP